MAQVLDVTAAEDPRDAVHRAVQALAEGKVVALPTETVYIAAASALSERAIERLLALRGGKLDVPATLAVRSTEEVLDYVPQLPPVGQRLARRCWPGPVTLQLTDAHPDSAVHRLPLRSREAIVPEGQIRVRVPAHELALRVMRLVKGPIVMVGAHRANGRCGDGPGGRRRLVERSGRCGPRRRPLQVRPALVDRPRQRQRL
jgi:protein-tyrosine phosphatase